MRGHFDFSIQRARFLELGWWTLSRRVTVPNPRSRWEISWWPQWRGDIRRSRASGTFSDLLSEPQVSPLWVSKLNWVEQESARWRDAGKGRKEWGKEHSRRKRWHEGLEGQRRAWCGSFKSCKLSMQGRRELRAWDWNEVGKAANLDLWGPRKSEEGFGLGPKGNWKPQRGLKQWRKMIDLHEK